MSTLAWYHACKLGCTSDIAGILTADILDIGEYFGHIGIDFVDGSRLVFNTIENEAEIIDCHDLSDEDRAAIYNLTRAKEV